MTNKKEKKQKFTTTLSSDTIEYLNMIKEDMNLKHINNVIEKLVEDYLESDSNN